MGFWDKVKGDVQKGLREGMAAIKEKAGELTDEGKRRYGLFELKSKVHKEMAELGGRVYGSKSKNPMLDVRVKASVSRLKKLEARIRKLEGAAKAAKKAR
jgi:hypothetical protein